MSTSHGNIHQDGEEGPKPLEKYAIPRGTLTRIMQQALPRDAKIAVDAKEAMDECLVEFSAAVMRAAVQECRRDRRLTVTVEDVILGFSNLGLADYVEPLTEYLRQYRESKSSMPRIRHTLMMPPPPDSPVEEEAAAAAAGPVAVLAVKEEVVTPPSPDLTLQLALPGSSRGRMPPAADDEE